MATYHLSVKFGGKGQAANHADYIERKEKYRDRQDLEYSAHGNMPEWARDNPSHFWQAADQFERANGSTYRELEIALPRELTPEQRLELVQDFVRQEPEILFDKNKACQADSDALFFEMSQKFHAGDES